MTHKKKKVTKNGFFNQLFTRVSVSYNKFRNKYLSFHGLFPWSKNYGWEIDLLSTIGLSSLYILDFHFRIDPPRSNDHSPALYTDLVVLNIQVFDISIYNIHHLKE